MGRSAHASSNAAPEEICGLYDLTPAGNYSEAMQYLLKDIGFAATRFARA